MTVKDNLIDPTVVECNEKCCLFRWNKCVTMKRPENGVWICDKPDSYDRGEEIYPEIIQEKSR